MRHYISQGWRGSKYELPTFCAGNRPETCHKEITRGQILLKLILRLDTHNLLVVRITCKGTSELIHIGQAVMSIDGTVEYFANTVFNYPTLAQAYKTAAFDGLNRLRG